MTPTDELRRLLDERGVEWTSERVSNGVLFTFAKDGRTYSVFVRDRAGLEIWSQYLTPEQAVEATLGNVPCLPYFWTHDGALHIELPKLPESISVRLPDQRDREVGSARVWQYTQGSGTCHVDVLNTGDCAGYECSEYIMHCNGCGHEFGHVLYNEDGDVWMSEPPNYCPNCGRKVVDE